MPGPKKSLSEGKAGPRSRRGPPLEYLDPAVPEAVTFGLFSHFNLESVYCNWDSLTNTKTNLEKIWDVLIDTNLLVRDFNYKTPQTISSLVRTKCCLLTGADLGSHLNTVLTSGGLGLGHGLLAKSRRCENPVDYGDVTGWITPDGHCLFIIYLSFSRKTQKKKYNMHKY